MKTKNWFNAFKVLVIILLVTAICLLTVACKEPENPPTPQNPVGTGTVSAVFYYPTTDGEQLIVLSNGDVTMVMDGVSKMGMCDQTGQNFTFTFGEDKVTALLNGNVLAVNYNNGVMNFLKKVYFEVDFDSVEGSQVASVSVLNGQTVAKPADPQREGHLFLGWYADEEYKTPFAFGTQIITENTTIYAKWAEVVLGQNEYEVNFDLNYEGAPTMQSIKTVGGRVFADVPQRDNYTFVGWWVSEDGSADKLSYKYNGEVLNQNTTLCAIWNADETGTKLVAPAVSVAYNKITWDNVGAKEYVVNVADKDGNTILNRTVQTLYVDYNFETISAGEYVITVYAVSFDGEANNSDVTTRYYTNKALAKVSIFNVTDSCMLIYNTVSGAEKYLITVNCGDAEHNHTQYDNGKSNNFSFANCSMKEGGIEFIVTAVAAGYVSSVSETFVYNKTLESVTGFVVDEETQTLTWNVVPFATNYIVSYVCDNSDHNHETIDNGSSVSYCFANCHAGKITFYVFPTTKGYNSSNASSFVYTKIKLETPSNVHVNGNMLLWDEVQDSNGYRVQIGKEEFVVDTNKFNLSTITEWAEETTISVMALGDNDSPWSDAIVVNYNSMYSSVKYSAGIVSWAHVLGAVVYEVKVNSNPVKDVLATQTKLAITLTQAGVNTISVRYFDGNDYSPWTTIEVYAYAVYFDSRSGSAVNTQYKAKGDPITFPSSNYDGHQLAGWYNAPGGPLNNAAKYSDKYFDGNGDIVLYAYWKSKGYTVNIVLKEGENCEVNTETVIYQENYTWAIATNDDGALGFIGWFSGPNCTGQQYTDGNGKSLGPWLYASDTIVAYPGFKAILNYTLMGDGNGYRVSKGEAIHYAKTLTIPSTYNDKPVKEIGDNAFNSGVDNVTEITIPYTIENISTINALTGFVNLQKITVTEAPEGTTELPKYFSDNGILYKRDTNGITIELFPSKLTAGEEGIRIFDGVTNIVDRAFKNAQITKITFPATVATLGSAIFSNSRIVYVVFEDAPQQPDSSIVYANTLTMQNDTFAEAGRLADIVLPSRYEVTEGDNLTFNTAPFSNSMRLVSIRFNSESKYASVNGVVFDKAITTLFYYPRGIDNVKYSIPSTVTAIADGAFETNEHLVEIDISYVISSIGNNAFKGSKQLTTVTFKGTNILGITIGDYAFANCKKLTNVTFEEGSNVKSIGVSAFENCESILVMTIPSTVTQVKDNAFKGCVNILQMQIEEGESLTFGTYVFSNCASIASIFIPKHVTGIPAGMFDGCTSLVTVEVDPENKSFKTINGAIYTVDEDGNCDTLFFVPLGTTGEFVVDANVKTIADSVFQNRTKITKVVIGAKVVSIGDYAFQGASGIGTIEFVQRDEVLPLTIGVNAFENCTALTSINLPEGLVEIDDYAFSSARSLSSLTIPSTVTRIGREFISRTSITDIVIPKNVVNVGYRAFYIARSLETIVFEQGRDTTKVTVFEKEGNKAETFAYCTFTTLVLPDNLQELSGDVLGGNTSSLTEINIPASVTTIGAGAFADTKIAKITFATGGTQPLTLQTSGTDGTFKGANNLKNIVLPSRLNYIPDNAFSGCSSLEYVYIPSSVSNQEISAGNATFIYGIGKNAFYGCVELKNVEFEMGGELPLSISDSAFKSCASLTTIKFPARLKSTVDASNNKVEGIFNYNVFAGCNSLATIQMENNDGEFKAIDGVLYSNNGATLFFVPMAFTGVVTVPKQVTLIGPNAFYKTVGVTGLVFEQGGTEDLVIGVAPTSSGSGTGTGTSSASVNVFSETSIETIAFPARLTKVNKAAFGTNKLLKTITFETGSRLEEIGESAFSGTPITSIIIPASVKTIGKSAFNNCKKLTSVTFEEGSLLETIGETAFKQTGITGALVIPANVTTIGKQAFINCFNLTSVTIPNALSTMSGLFDGCISLREIVIPTANTNFVRENDVIFNATKTTLYMYPASKTDKEYTIPDTVTAIGDYAFYDNSYLETLIMPEGLKTIGAYAFQYSSIKTVQIPASVTTIGDYAFANSSLTNITFAAPQQGEENLLPVGLTIGTNVFRYSDLASIILPARLSSLGGYSFANTDKLQSITFEDGCQLAEIPANMCSNSAIKTIVMPASVTKINSGAFQYASELTSATINGANRVNNIGASAFSGTSSLTSFDISKLTTFGNNMFENSGITSVTIPASFASASNTSMFKGCTRLTTVVVEEGVKYIQTYTFQNCTALTSVTLPSSLTKIANYAFQNTAIVSVEIGDKVSSLGNYIFAECANLTSVKLPNRTSNTNLGTHMFRGCTSLKSIYLPAKIKLNTNTFEGCTSLESVEFASGTTHTTIAKSYVFKDCTSLKTIINWPTTLTKLSSTDAGMFANTGFESFDLSVVSTLQAPYLFEGCKNLKTVNLNPKVTTLPNYIFRNSGIDNLDFLSNVTEISEGAFAGCQNLKKFDLDNGKLTKIGKNAFLNCHNMTQVTIPETVTTIQDNAFKGTAINEITITSNLTSIGNGAFAGTNLKSFDVASSNTVYSVLNDVLYSNDGTVLVAYPSGKEGNYIAPMRVTEFKPYAFTGSNVGRITIQNPETKLSDYAFSGVTSLGEVVLPEGLTSLVKYMFDGCTSLTTVNIPSTVTTIPDYAFNNSGITNIVLHEGITSIGTYAFAGTSQLSIDLVIPTTVTSIGANAFENSGITGVEILAEITTLNAYTFNGCANLESVILPSTLVSFNGTHVFANTTALDTIVLPQNFTTLSNFAFSHSGISSIKLSTKITKLTENLFEYCANLRTVELHEGITDMSKNTFMGSGVESIKVPTTVTKLETGVFAATTKLKTIELHDGITQMSDTFMNSALERITIPASMTKIPDRLFSGCANLVEVILHENVDTFGIESFANCNKLNLTITGYVTTMNNSFVGWVSTQSITFTSYYREFGPWGKDGEKWKQDNAARIVYATQNNA